MSGSVADREWTIGELLSWTAQFLGQKGVESPRLDAELLLASALNCRRIDLYGRYFTEVASNDVRQQYRTLIQQRLVGCPVAYLLGKKEFFQLEFEVNPSVLIPRPDTEILVSECIAKAKGFQQPRILDLGTGSGNIPICLARHLPSAQITTIDISVVALEVAQRNAEKHDVSNRIDFLHGDLFDALSHDVRFDLIVSNPPYVSQEDLAELAKDVKEFEPHLALDGGPSGFEFYRRIAKNASQWLLPGGFLLLEIGFSQDVEVRQFLEQEQSYDLLPTVYDYGGQPRVIVAQCKK